MRRALDAVDAEAGPVQPLDHDHERIAADAELRRFAERTVVFEDRLDARGFVMVAACLVLLQGDAEIRHIRRGRDVLVWHMQGRCAFAAAAAGAPVVHSGQDAV